MSDDWQPEKESPIHFVKKNDDMPKPVYYLALAFFTIALIALAVLVVSLIIFAIAKIWSAL